MKTNSRLAFAFVLLLGLFLVGTDDIRADIDEQVHDAETRSGKGEAG